MNPDATLANLIDAAVAGDAEEVKDYAGILSDWLKGGGFAPLDPRHTALPPPDPPAPTQMGS
jgi:hypothetical protein